MKSIWLGFRSVLAEGIERFLACKRSLGRRFDTEERTLRLFDRYLADPQSETVEDGEDGVVRPPPHRRPGVVFETSADVEQPARRGQVEDERNPLG